MGSAVPLLCLWLGLHSLMGRSHNWTRFAQVKAPELGQGHHSQG